ncbi:MAG: helix-turn-helix domain-containing protein [Gammaproteobacteria bacterium]
MVMNGFNNLVAVGLLSGTSSYGRDWSAIPSEQRPQNHPSPWPCLYRVSGDEIGFWFLIEPPSGSSVYQEVTERNGLAVREILDAFGLTKAELATLCSRTRKTIYNWLDGKSSPSRENSRKLYELLLVARAWRAAGLPANRNLLHRPVIGGKNMFELLGQSPADKDLILFAGNRLTMSSPTVNILDDPFAE